MPSDRPAIVKIKAVAEQAGVSVATVSRVLNHNPTVATDLAERVMRAVDEMGYRPNGIARSLRTRTTQTLALLIPDISNPFFAEMARGAEDTAVAARYSILLCNTDEDHRKERVYLDLANEARVAGVILSPHDRDADISRLKSGHLPMVVVDRPLRSVTDFVGVRSFDGARTATRHLMEQGWARPACITGPRSAYTAATRLRGYLAAVREQSGTPLYRHADFKSESGRAAAASLLDGEIPPDAILTANEPMALGVLAELATRGVRIGKDIGFVTFDDAPWAPFVDPPITVVSQPAYEIGAQACERLLELIQSGHTLPPRRVMLETKLIVRGSSLRSKDAYAPGS